MTFTTSQTITLTATASDANRIQAAAVALGFPSIKAMIVSAVMSQVSSYEQQANQQTCASSYTPVQPT